MADVDLTPTAEMARNAARGLELRRKERNVMSKKRKAIMERLGMAAMNDRPDAKAKMGKASDALNYIKNSIASGKTVYVTAGNRITKVTPKAYEKWEASGRPLFKLGGDGALLMASGSSYVRLTMGDDMMLASITAMSRPGAKAKMAMTPIHVTEAEYAALAARDAVSRKILGDSRYQITPSDRAIRAAGDAAYKTALARHNAWDKAWRDAPNDAARAEVEARAKAAEAGMRVYRGSRSGAKAKFAVTITGRQGRQPGIPGGWLTGSWDGGKWAALVFAEGSEVYGLPEFRNISKLWIADTKGKEIVNYDRGWDVKPATPEARQAFMEIGRVASAEASKMPASRPGAKAKMGRAEEQMLARLEKELQELGYRPSNEPGLAERMNAIRREIKLLKQSVRASRPGAKVRAALADACWEGYEAVGTKPQDGKTVPNCVPKMKAGRAEDLYRKLSGGTITNANVREWDRLVTEALRMPDFTPPGGDMSLHEIAEDLGGEIMALKSRAAKAQAAKDTMAAATPHKVTVTDKAGTARTYMVSDRVRRSIEGTKKQAEARGTAPAYDDVIRLGIKMGEVVEASKAKAEKPAEGDLEREDVKAGLKLMSASDPAVSDKIRTLIAEGKPQDQAVAIALDMKRRGEI